MPNRLFFILLILFASFGLGACTPVGVAVGAGAKVISASQSERGLEGTAKDIALRTEINHYLFQSNVDLFASVGLSVSDGRVLLTGSVKKPEDRIEAARLTWKAENVREVINEIQVTDKTGLIDIARDTLIETQLEAKLSLMALSSRLITISIRLTVPSTSSALPRTMPSSSALSITHVILIMSAMLSAMCDSRGASWNHDPDPENIRATLAGLGQKGLTKGDLGGNRTIVGLAQSPRDTA